MKIGSVDYCDACQISGVGPDGGPCSACAGSGHPVKVRLSAEDVAAMKRRAGDVVDVWRVPQSAPGVLSAQAELALTEHVETLRAVLAPLLDSQPEYVGGMKDDGGYRCRFCQGTAADVFDVRHAERCAFLRRDELLGR